MHEISLEQQGGGGGNVQGKSKSKGGGKGWRWLDPRKGNKTTINFNTGPYIPFGMFVFFLGGLLFHPP